MVWAGTTWGDGAWGDADDVDAATAPTLAEILAAEHQVFAVVIDMPLRAGGSTTLYWSDRYYVSRASDDPASTQFTPIIDVLEDEMGANISPFGSGDNSIRGRVRVSDIDGKIEALFDTADYFKAPIEIWVGRSAGLRWASRDDDPWAWFQCLGRFTIADITASDDGSFEVSYRDRSYELDVEVQVNRYAGTGTYEGGSALLSEPKPLVGGYCYFVELRLVDPVYQIYQGTDGGFSHLVGSIVIFDNAVVLTTDGTSTNLYGDTIAAGHCRVDMARGMVRLGASPAGRVCGMFGGLGVVRASSLDGEVRIRWTHFDVLRAAIAARLPSFVVNVASFDALGDALASPIVIPPPYPGGPVVTLYDEMIASFVIDPGLDLRQMANRLLSAIGASWWMSYEGPIEVGRLSVPTAAEVELDLDIWSIQSLSREKLPDTLTPPPYLGEIIYNQVQSWPQAGNIASGADDGIKQRLQKQFRTSVVEDEDILDKYRNAEKWLQFDMLSYTQPPSDLAMRHMLATHGGTAADGTIFDRLFLHIRTDRRALGLRPLSVVKVTWPRLGLDSGKLFRVWPGARQMVGNDPSGVDLILWGGFEP